MAFNIIRMMLFTNKKDLVIGALRGQLGLRCRLMIFQICYTFEMGHIIAYAVWR